MYLVSFDIYFQTVCIALNCPANIVFLNRQLNYVLNINSSVYACDGAKELKAETNDPNFKTIAYFLIIRGNFALQRREEKDV